MNAAVHLQNMISPLRCLLREAEQRPPVVLAIQANLDDLQSLADAILGNRTIPTSQVSSQLLTIITLLEASPLVSVEPSPRGLSSLTQARAGTKALESFSNEIKAKTKQLSSLIPAPLRSDGGAPAAAAVGFTAWAAAAADPDAATNLYMTGNQQLGRGAMTVGVYVGRKRQPGAQPLQQVMRGAHFLDNVRGDPRHPRRQAGLMVVGARFSGEAEVEAVAGTFRDNRNYDDGPVVDGICIN